MDAGLSIRPAKSEEAHQIASLYQEAYAGKYSYLDYTHPEFVSRAIGSRYFWRVALAEDEVVGSAVGVPMGWNSSVEVGRAVVKHQYARNGLAKAMCNQVCSDSLESGYVITWGTIRTFPIYRVSVSDGMSLVGYLPGAHQVETRETHLLCMRLSDEAKHRRVSPPRNWVYDQDVVKEILETMGLHGAPVAPYPARSVVGPQASKQLCVYFSYVEADQAAALTQVEWGYERLPKYLQVVVLTDKTDTIDLIRQLGFELTAFLPAWYEEMGKRYDCVLLGNSLGNASVTDGRLRAIVDRFRTSFGNRREHSFLRGGR